MKELRRLTRNGNSTHVAMPAAFLEHLGWRAGEPIVVELTAAGTVEIRRPTIADLRAPGIPLTLDASAPAGSR